MVARYEISDKIGQGGMGEVFLAEDATLDRRVALKRLPEKLRDDESSRKRFLREAKSAAALDHPYICKIFEIGEDDEGPFIAMEFIRGETLERRLTQGAMSPDAVRRIAFEICEALETAHAAGIVHRDLKPSNIMLTEDGHAKVMDFGLATRETSFERDASSQLTAEGAAVGTIAYMSPEQLRAEPVDARSDIFSLGIVLYEMATGTHPFRKKSSMETAAAILNEKAVPTKTTFDTALERTLEKERDERYRRVQDLKVDLAQPKSKQHGVKLVVAIAAVLGAVGLGLWLIPREPPSVAVLPFQNVSNDPLESDYLAQGITRAVITKLTQSGIQVSPWESVRRYGDRVPLVAEVAGELSVDAILMGTFELVDDRIVTTLSLVDGATGLQSWAEELDEPFEDIFRVQRRIATGAATSLNRGISGEQEQALAEPESRSVDAYDYYLQGAHILQEGTEEASNVAFDYFMRAIELDPELVEAHIGIGAVQTDFYYYGWGGRESIEAARKSFETATRLKPTSMRAQRGLCYVRFVGGQGAPAVDASTLGGDSDVETALTQARCATFAGLVERGAAHYRRALELDPRNEEALFFLSVATFGSPESIETGNTYFRLFGDYHDLHAYVAHTHNILGNTELALEHYEKSMSYGNVEALTFGGMLYADSGDPAKARLVWQQGVAMIVAKLEAYPDNPYLRLSLATLYGLLGDPAAMRAHEELVEASTPRGVYLAAVHAWLGNGERAAALLRHALAAGMILPRWHVFIRHLASEAESGPLDPVWAEFDAEIERLRETY